MNSIFKNILESLNVSSILLVIRELVYFITQIINYVKRFEKLCTESSFINYCKKNVLLNPTDFATHVQLTKYIK